MSGPFLHNLIAPQTNPEIRERGASCLEKVCRIEKTIFGWQALVCGHENYEVNFFLGGKGEWAAECNCGHFEIHGEICKHIVAAALIIDAKETCCQ